MDLVNGPVAYTSHGDFRDDGPLHVVVSTLLPSPWRRTPVHHKQVDFKPDEHFIPVHAVWRLILSFIDQ